MKKIIYRVALLFIGFMTSVAGRSHMRSCTTLLPTITIVDSRNSPLFALSHRNLSWYPTFFFTLDKLLPFTVPSEITYRDNPSRSLSRDRLSVIINTFIREIMDGCSSFTDVVILQTKNFNLNRRCGLIVAKCKNHPFVIKLFMESPQSYFDPYCKGVESVAFFFAAGGVNRHCAGLSRIINLYAVQDTLRTMPEWTSRIIFPRKWLWIKEDQEYLHFKGYNIIPGAVLENSIPSIFAIIADEINMNDVLDIPLSNRKKIIMKLCNQLNLAIDPHVPNFVFKKSPNVPFTISILDTEHFPTMVNLHNPPHFKSYCSWYAYLIVNFFSKTLFRYKNEDRVLPEPLLQCAHSLPKCC